MNGPEPPNRAGLAQRTAEEMEEGPPWRAGEKYSEQRAEMKADIHEVEKEGDEYSDRCDKKLEE